MAFNPVIYLNATLGDGGPCTSWNYVDNFDQYYTQTAFWWGQRYSLSYYNVWWNNACAIKLIIDKCNSLQAELDAGAGAVDMDAIINAMLASKFDNLQKFIGLVDAYRVAIWNAPFNAEFYSALARGFQKWP